MKEGSQSQGAGTSAGGGGGRGPDGKPAERSEVDDNVDGLKQHVKKTQDLIKSLNEVSNGVRKGEVDPDLLAKLNVAREEARRGAGEAFDRSETEDKEIGVTSRDPNNPNAKPGQAKDGKDGIFESGARPEVVESSELKTGDLSPDKLRDLVESGKINVSPQYRRMIERYLAELSEKK